MTAFSSGHGERPRALDPSSVLASGANWLVHSSDDWRDPTSPAHYDADGTHAATNLVYGDGHVETHRAPLSHYVTRSDGDKSPY